MIPRFKPQYGWREWLAAWRFTRGNIPAYEAAFARKFGVEHGTMFPHGRSGMYALFKVWGLEKAEIVCPAYTCVVVQHAVVLSDNVPVFVDCPEGDFNMDLGKLEAAITEKTRCVVATHLFGYPTDLDALGAIVARAEEKYGHKIYVLQDVAHSYGTEWNGRLVTEYGDAAIFGWNQQCPANKSTCS
ncbi:MAG: DegT/DnrJ/EryC1/StrS family aminotransferase [Bacteroidota bacterium]